MTFDNAAAGVPDYWIVNMVDREVEVYRVPVPDVASITRFRYASRRVQRLGSSIAPLARPDASNEVTGHTAPPGPPPIPVGTIG